MRNLKGFLTAILMAAFFTLTVTNTVSAKSVTSGSDNKPNITVSSNNLAFGTICSGSTSTVSFTVSGNNFRSNTMLIASSNGSNVNFSTSQNGTYTSSLTLSASSGVISTTTIYVRYSGGNSNSEDIIKIRSNNEDLASIKGSATTSGAPSITTQPSLTGQTVCLNVSATGLSVAASSGGSGSEDGGSSNSALSSLSWYSSSVNSNSGGTLVSTVSLSGSSSTKTLTPNTSSEGTYYYYAVVTNANGCTATSNASGSVTVSTTPAPSASSNGPLCVGSTLSLSTPAVSGATYSWRGPNAFSSSLRTPSINTVTTAAAGTYSLTVSANGCTSAVATTVVVVNSIPTAPTAGNNGVSCPGSTLNLTASLINNATYAWTGPNGFSSSLQNPSIPNATSSASGTYSVTVSVNGCISTAATTVATIGDLIAPTIQSPADLEVNSDIGVCTATVLSLGTPVTADNCSVASVTNDHPSTTYALGTTTVTWTVTDGSGNTATSIQKVVVSDKQVPVLSSAPSDATVSCDAVPTAATLTATDNCDSTPVVTYNEVRTDGNSPSNYTLTRTWTATDASGNTSSKTQVITVQDTTAPVLSSAPADATVSCDAVPTAATLTATDNCDASPVVTYNEERTNGSSTSNYTLTRTWTATDASGNTSSKTQVITVQDVTAPVLSSVPSDATVSCDAIPTAATLTATDNCDASPVVTYNEERTNGSSPSDYTLTRTWTATDASGNNSSKTQVITVQDTTAPILSSAPADATVSCDAVPTASTLTATDNCDATPVVTYNEVRTDGNSPSNYTLTRTWTATDASGNTSSKTQVITVQDTTAPILSSAPADATVSCDAVPTAATLTATDNCDATPVVNYNEVRTDGSNSNNYVLSRTWTATDASGNSSTKTQMITVQDKTAPVLTGVPANVTVSCDGVPTAATVTAQDNCDGSSTVDFKEESTQVADATKAGHYNYILVRTWTTTDQSGNSANSSQVITVVDNTAPVLTVTSGSTANVSVQYCGGTVPAPAVLAAADVCSGAVSVIYNQVRTEGTAGTNTIYSLTRTWTATDVTGNSQVITQVISVVDDKAPVTTLASLPVISAQCSVTIKTGKSGEERGDEEYGEDEDGRKGIPTKAYGSVPTAKDNCAGTIKGTTIDPLTYTTQGTYYINWSFDDGHGNISHQIQTIVVSDVKAPKPTAEKLEVIKSQCSVVIGSRVTVSHHEGEDGDDNGISSIPTAVDNCAGVIRATTEDPLTYTAQGTYTIHWKFDDGHGNVVYQNQTVIIKDNQSPAITAPKNITVNCGASTLTAATGTATAADNCSTPVISFTESTKGNVISRTWKATDAAGNSSTSVQTITIGLAISNVLVNSVPATGANTGGINTNLFLGYGAQSTTLQVGSLSSAGAPYTYSWTGIATNKLNNTSTANPVFTPTEAGSSLFTVTVTNKFGCTTTTSISICVTDIRVAGTSGSTAKVNVCHTPSGKNAVAQTLQVLVSQVPQHLNSGCGNIGSDRLGSCNQNPCNIVAGNSNATSVVVNSSSTKETGTVQTENTTESLTVIVAPNPSTTRFTLKILSDRMDPVELRVVDLDGRVIDSRSKIAVNSTIQIGERYQPGTYFVELRQGARTRTVQLLKL